MAISVHTFNSLKRTLSEGFHVVFKPDHPMLLSGPDILVGGEGKLTAIFCIEKKDSEKQVLARLMGARLALPSNTRVFAEIADDVFPESSFMHNFDEVHPQQRITTFLSEYCRSDAQPRVDKSALLETKRRHAEKYAFALLLASLRRKHELTVVRPDALIQQLSNMLGAEQREEAEMSGLKSPNVRWQGSYVASLPPSPQTMRELRVFCDVGLTASYQLDTGVPYELQDTELNVLLVDRWPDFRHDPEKPLRSAAFGCWIMAESSSAEDINLLIEKARNPKFMRRLQHA